MIEDNYLTLLNLILAAVSAALVLFLKKWITEALFVSSISALITTQIFAVILNFGFGDSSVDYILRFWIRDPTEGLTNIRGNVYLALWDAFKANGISIPFPQREVRMLAD